MKAKLLIYAVATSLVLFSCEKYSSYLGTSLGGTQSPIGDVDNTFTFSNPNGISNPTARVTDLTNGISTISGSVDITDAKLLTLAGYLTVGNLSGHTLSGQIKVKITSDGIETEHTDGKLILVKYNAKVGDKYTLKTKNTTITREVMSVSTTDDYYWGGMLIKTMVVKETEDDTPGVSKIEYVLNHKFGLVGVNLYYTDGTSRSIDVYSTKTN